MLVILLAFLVGALDQATKWQVRATFDYGVSHPVIPGFFNLTYVRNTGAAWGMLGGQNAVLTVLSVVILALMIVFRRSFLGRTWEHRLSLALLIGGVAGNLLDRVRLGWVTDFLDFHVRGWHWPAFNIADAAICVGVGLYIMSALWVAGHPLNESRRASKTPPSADSPTGS